MKIIVVLVLVAVMASLNSCAGFSVHLRTPYGDASSKNGIITIAPKAQTFVVPEK